MKRALIIEDDDAIRENVVELLTEEGFACVAASDGREGLELARRETPGLVVCDVRMPGLDGFDVLAELRAAPETRAVPFIFLSAASERSSVRHGMNLGADDYVTKPFTRAELLDAVRSRLMRREVLSSAAPGPRPRTGWEPAPLDLHVVADPAMQALYAQLAKAAAASISVLLLGETGVGKEVVARSVHDLSPRKGGPFLGLNCAALSETLLESELFGNERGAFTGAVATRPGLFESAQGGTVFLDEVGDLPMVIQVKLLRVLEERRVIRVGGRAPIPIDVRFVAATNRDLDEGVAKGTFRQDLFYRLAGITLTVPPLRERRAEILPLAEGFARASVAKLGRAVAPELSPEAARALLDYAWPGNVRELRNVVERAVVLAGARAIEPSHLPDKITRGAGDPPGAPRISEAAPRASEAPESGPPSSRSLRGDLEDLERKRIVEALERCGGNQTAAASLLGMSRRTLVSRLSAYALPRPRKRPT